MLNVDKAMAMLERLDDTSLQRYAQMHKQDPYMLSLALSESNRRKRMRASASMQAAQGPEPPPVADQAIMGMAPENTGIAQLPVADMDFADGGIIAFAGAGEVQSSPFDYLPKALRDRMLRPLVESGRLEERPLPPPTAELPGIADLLRYVYGGAKDRLSNFLSSQVEEQRALAEKRPPLTPATAADAAALAGDTIRASRSGAPAASGIAALPGAERNEKLSGGLSAAASERTRVSGPAAPAPAAPRDISSAIDAAYRSRPTEVPGLKALEAAAAESSKASDATRAAYEASLPSGRPMEGLRTRLEKEEGEVESKKEENLKMALINAGLAMMAGTSQYAMANIGAGGAQGMKAYREGVKDLEKAAERRQELFAKVEQAERAEQEGRANTALRLRQQADETQDKWRAAAIKAVMETHGVNRAEALNIVKMEEDALRAAADRESRERIAARQEAGASSRSAAAIKAGEARETAANLRARVDLLRARLLEVQRQLTSMPTGGIGPQKDEYARLVKERDQITKAMDSLTRQLAGEPATATGADTSGFTVKKVTPAR